MSNEPNGDQNISALEENKIKAEEAKDAANKLFSAKKYEAAIEKYSEAINLNPNVAVYYSNRSFAYFKTEAFGYAVTDADSAIKLDPSYTKGYYRRAAAKMALCKFEEAQRDFRIVVKKAPTDKDAKAKLLECEKIVKRIKFEEAIEVDSPKKNILDTLEVNSIVVEPSYGGPKFEDGKITKDFIEEMMEYFKNQKKIHRKYAFEIILAVRKIMLETPSLVDITIPQSSKLTVCGDVHGQYYDFINIFKINGVPSETNMYLFNGDFVDRGSFSLEVILTLFAYKWLYPKSLYLTRGNHETDDMNKVYGFEGEVKAKYSESMFDLFSETFSTLPLAHLINRKILVVHGGLFSRDDVTLDDIRNIDRFGKKHLEQGSLMCELLWSDPQIQPGRGPSKRGVGIQFGPDVTENFLKRNNLELLIRSHEVKENGYVIDHNGKCITVFSAPNYCDTIGNKGAIINITPDLKLEYKTFEAVPHPNIRPMAYINQLGSMFM
ncbi:Metallo-dependent phosphatase-like protein [Glomus cerebriforme]|uniref:Serine/threonine-protein phosphatase T n=1 Tax=Glomus cerebriforme TaxID=658196 RepID=A0A397SGW6_9GLOM|nr:Metallo-dependent phosphatase-like protein [Glomus cerebriforme]